MKIHCPNCKYEGKAKDITPGCLQLIFLVVLVMLSIFFWPLFIVTGLMFLYFIFSGKVYACPECKWKNPIPLHKYKERNVEPKVS